jgi:truncated hemoglobin YjbI
VAERHRGAGTADDPLTGEQRVRWVARLARTADQVLLPDDPDTRQAFLSDLE